MAPETPRNIPTEDTYESPFLSSLRQKLEKIQPKAKATIALVLQLAPYVVGTAAVGAVAGEQAWQKGAFGLPPLQTIDTSGHIQKIQTNADGDAYVLLPAHTIITFGENGTINSPSNPDDNTNNAQQAHESTRTILNSTDSTQLVYVDGQQNVPMIAAAQADQSHNSHAFPSQTGTPLNSDIACTKTLTAVENTLSSRRTNPTQNATMIVEEISESSIPFISMNKPHTVLSLGVNANS